MDIIEKMSKDLRISKQLIYDISQNNNLYKTYYKKKKNSRGKRKIFHPSKELKVLQYWVVKNIIYQFPVSDFSCAYERGNSIKNNALIHKNSSYILHLDIRNFFESITEEHVELLFKQISNLSKQEIELLKNIVMFRDDKTNIKKLVIGSVSSPSISNRIMYQFDNELYETCIKDTDMKYSRYADDIYISSNKYIDIKIVSKVSEILKKYKFNINDRKTYFMSKSCKRVVTGIILDNNCNKLSLGSKKYKEIKKMIYEFLIKSGNSKDYKTYLKIKGYLSLIKNIEKSKYESLKNTYIKYDKDNILFKKSIRR